MNLFVFWATSILWDLITNLITMILIIVLLIIGKHEHWKSFDELATVFLILLVYNIAMMPIICLWSLVFRKPSLGTCQILILTLKYLVFSIGIFLFLYLFLLLGLNVVTFANILICKYKSTAFRHIKPTNNFIDYSVFYILRFRLSDG